MEISIWWLVATNYLLVGVVIALLAADYHRQKGHDYETKEWFAMVFLWLPIFLVALIGAVLFEIWSRARWW